MFILSCLSFSEKKSTFISGGLDTFEKFIWTFFFNLSPLLIYSIKLSSVLNKKTWVWPDQGMPHLVLQRLLHCTGWGWMDRWTEGWMDRGLDGQRDGWTEGWVDRCWVRQQWEPVSWTVSQISGAPLQHTPLVLLPSGHWRKWIYGSSSHSCISKTVIMKMPEISKYNWAIIKRNLVGRLKL